MSRARREILTLAMGLILIPPGRQAQAADSPEWRVDRRVELASVLCRLAGYEEYQPVRVPEYDEAVSRHFYAFRGHSAVRLMQKLRKERGISYNAGLEAALLTDERTWGPRLPVRPVPGFVDRRWDETSLTAFLKAFAGFARDTGASGFFDSQADVWQRIEQAHSARFPSEPDLAWYRSRFAVPASTSFRLIPGLLTGISSYGIHVLLPDGRMEVLAVVAQPTHSEDRPLEIPEQALQLIVHEFCHPFVNPWVDANSGDLRSAAEALFAVSAATMKAEAYTSWQVMMYESLVRAATVRYFMDHAKPGLVKWSLEDDRKKGFWWTRELSALFEPPDDAAHPTLGQNPDRVRLFFEEWARDPHTWIAKAKAAVAAEREAELRRGPQILSLTPADGDEAVDPSVSAVELKFDRPMTATLSLFGDFPQVAGKPSWNEDKTVLRIPVTLKPGAKYTIRINSDQDDGGFRSTAGERLTPRTWTFSVKNR